MKARTYPFVKSDKHKLEVRLTASDSRLEKAFEKMDENSRRYRDQVLARLNEILKDLKAFRKESSNRRLTMRVIKKDLE